MKTIHFSVIIPTRNRKSSLIRLLKSLEKAKYSGNVEIIVVDNLSSDGTKKQIKSFSLSSKNTSRRKITIISEKRRGPTFARNTGVSRAKYNHILFIDDDCVVPKSYFRDYQLLWNKYPDAKIIVTKMVAVCKSKALSNADRKRIKKFPWVYGQSYPHASDAVLKGRENACSANMSYKVNSKNERDGKIFDERLGNQIHPFIFIGGEDVELTLSQIYMQEKIIFSPYYQVYHFFKKDRLSNSYLLRRIISASLDCAISDTILSSKFSNFKNTVYSDIRMITRDTLALKNIRQNWELVNSPYKIIFYLSYVLFKKMIGK